MGAAKEAWMDEMGDLMSQLKVIEEQARVKHHQSRSDSHLESYYRTIRHLAQITLVGSENISLDTSNLLGDMVGVLGRLVNAFNTEQDLSMDPEVLLTK